MKVAIYWYGAEGQSNYRYYQAKGDDVTIVTTAVSDDYPIPEGAKAIVQEDAYNHLDGFDLVVRSAGVRPDSLKTDGTIWSATNEFFAQCKSQIIGVTGTKGKGTTASLITEILRAAGKNVHLVGNIGVPPLELLSSIAPDDIVVYELSSFQLWDIKMSPHIAVVLMVEPDHLNVHTDMQEYVEAKAGISQYQTENDVIIYHPTNRYSADIVSMSMGKKIRYAIADDGGAYVRDDAFYYGNERICSTDVMQIPGAHNIENACAAITAVMKILGDTNSIEQGLRTFSGLPHRLKFVREVNGVRYFDDSIATTPGSAIAAIHSFVQPKVIILGGSQKGSVYDEIVAVCKSTNTRVIAIGQTGHTIAELCREQGIPVEHVEGTMNDIVSVASHTAASGDVVILSPASASFDMFKSYSDRGEQFISAVSQL